MKKLIAKTAGIGALAMSMGQYALAAVPSALTEGVTQTKPDDAPSQLIGQGGIFTTIANVLILLVGVVAVIMLIIGGLKYVLSNGDEKGVTSAKNTILYSIIGLIVAILAFAAVTFVVERFQNAA